jgi:hypothetical protein
MSKHRVIKKTSGKPKRPLSAYNLFFQHERNLMVREALENSEDKMSLEEIDQAMKTGRGRPHRKTHGKVQFKVLTSRVSGKWRTLSSDKKEVFVRRAGIEAKRYQAEVAKWRKEREMKMMQQVVSSISVSDDEESVTTMTQPQHAQQDDIEPLPVITDDEPLSIDASCIQALNVQTMEQQIEPDLVSYGSVSPCASPEPQMEPVYMSYNNTPCFTPEPQAFQQIEVSPVPQQEVSLGVAQMVGLLSHLGDLASTLDEDCFDMLSQLK